MKKIIYKIELKNWEKHNGKNKKGHTHFMLSKRFFDDPKVLSLSPGGRCLLIGLIGGCSDLQSRFIEASHEVLLRFCGGSGHVVQRLLDQLQCLQILSYEKIFPFINRKEENRKEEKYIQKEKTDLKLLHETKTPKLFSEPKFSFDEFFKKYPVRSKGPNAEKRFHDQIKTQNDADSLNAALTNYINHLNKPENEWKKPKQTFAAFLGTKSSGYFWKDWIDPESGNVIKKTQQIFEQSFFGER